MSKDGEDLLPMRSPTLNEPRIPLLRRILSLFFPVLIILTGLSVALTPAKTFVLLTASSLLTFTLLQDRMYDRWRSLLSICLAMSPFFCIELKFALLLSPVPLLISSVTDRKTQGHGAIKLSIYLTSLVLNYFLTAAVAYFLTVGITNDTIHTISVILSFAFLFPIWINVNPDQNLSIFIWSIQKLYLHWVVIFISLLIFFIESWQNDNKVLFWSQLQIVSLSSLFWALFYYLISLMMDVFNEFQLVNLKIRNVKRKEFGVQYFFTFKDSYMMIYLLKRALYRTKLDEFFVRTFSKLREQILLTTIILFAAMFHDCKFILLIFFNLSTQLPFDTLFNFGQHEQQRYIGTLIFVEQYFYNKFALPIAEWIFHFVFDRIAVLSIAKKGLVSNLSFVFHNIFLGGSNDSFVLSQFFKGLMLKAPPRRFEADIFEVRDVVSTRGIIETILIFFLEVGTIAASIYYLHLKITPRPKEKKASTRYRPKINKVDIISVIPKRLLLNFR
eukprot:TRINITY_DN14145_c0_g1_i4.p1 TRINITY_DN14145_c0_g1~~TRINITY_DN14145_c0_g1_i4.p1  ORF type:complete len:501 (+),score=44.08 TRINITY_DN14145_c0_g1_i4:307-1809(+)